MGKKKKKLKRKKSQTQSSSPSFPWMGEDGFHCLMPGVPPSPEQLENMTEEYQKQIRNSPFWDDMVREFGKEKPDKLLKQCRVKLG